MSKVFAVLVAVLLMACQTHRPRTPVHRIFPSDVVQESVRLIQYSPGIFGVSWTYSHRGAGRLAAFWRGNAADEAEYRIGAAKVSYFVDPLGGTGRPGAWAEYTREAFFFLSEGEATNIVAGLRAKWNIR